MEPFPIGQHVRFVTDLPQEGPRPPVPADSEGVVNGYYRRDALEYAVSVRGHVYAVAPEHLVPAEGDA